MDWLLLVVLGIIWAAFLIPRRGESPGSSVNEFEGDMQRIANVQRPGRFVFVPRERFVGPRLRAKVRARQRRRRVFAVLLEAIGLSLLIGAFPPLRAMWAVTGALIVLLTLYAAAVVRVAGGYRPRHVPQVEPAAPAPAPAAEPGPTWIEVPGPEPAVAVAADGVITLPEAEEDVEVRLVSARAGTR